MTAIADYQGYVEKMARAIKDKAWFLNEIPEEVDTIIDIGCANGELFDYIDSVENGVFTYIGFDTNEDMIAEAEERFAKNPRAFFFTSFEDIKVVEPERTVVVLNSVIHEVCSYSHVRDFISALKALGAKYIAIRDMTNERMTPNVIYNKYLDAIENAGYRDRFDEHIKACLDRREGLEYVFHHFFLKFLYEENWEREVKEQYLWDISSFVRALAPFGYNIWEERHFYIDYLSNKVMEVFGIRWHEKTHVKYFLVRE